MAFKWPPKDPNEVLDYEHDWSLRLEDDEEIVGLPLCLVDVGDVAVDSSTLNPHPTTARQAIQKVWLSGGTVKESGEPENLTLRVTTTAGRTYDEGINVSIRER